MGLTSKCASFCKCLKVDRKAIAFAICTLLSIYLIVCIIVMIVIPDVPEQVFRFRLPNYTMCYLLIASYVIQLVACVFLFVGIKMDKTWMLFVWILVMTIFWNIFLAAGIVSIVNYMLGGLSEEVAQTPMRSMIFIIIQVVWLLMIAYIWFYWRNLMKMTDDVPNLVEYIRERSSSSVTPRTGT